MASGDLIQLLFLKSTGIAEAVVALAPQCGLHTIHVVTNTDLPYTNSCVSVRSSSINDEDEIVSGKAF